MRQVGLSPAAAVKTNVIIGRAHSQATDGGPFAPWPYVGGPASNKRAPDCPVRPLTSDMLYLQLLVVSIWAPFVRGCFRAVDERYFANVPDCH